MANVLSLALKVTADASGLKLDPVQRALQRLGDQSDALSGQFAKFAGESSAAGEAQKRFADRSQDLINALRDGKIGATQFATEMERLSAAADKEAAAFERAAQITEQNRSEAEKFARTQTELRGQLDAGRITQETYNRAVEQAARRLNDAERAAAGLPPQLNKIAAAGEASTLKFNELSGIFSALPGPLGSIAGRISGITSAGEGLSRVFAGGSLQQGFASLGGSITALVNPFTIAAGAVLGFGAAASAVANGLAQLEDRVEKLGNTADKLGVSFEFIQTLEESARRSGTSIESVSAAFGRLQKNVLGVDEESKAAQKALSELGVTAAEIQNLKPEEQYRLIGDRLKAIEDPARRTAAATALFGRAGADLLPFFRNLGGAATDIEQVGRALTAIDRQRIDDFGAAVDKLGVSTQGLGQTLLLPFAGLGEGISNAIASVAGGITRIIDPIGRILEPVLTTAGKYFELLGTAIGGIGEVIGAVFEPFATLVQGVFQAVEPLYDLLLNVGKSIVTAGVETAKWVISFTPIGQIATSIEVVGQTIGRIVNIIVTAFQRAGEYVTAFVRQVGEFIAQSPLLDSIGNTITAVFGSISSIFGTIASSIGGVVGRLLTMAEKFLGIKNNAEAAGEAVKTVDIGPPEWFDDYDKAVGKTRELLSKAIDESAQFGQAGFDAALQFQEAVNRLQQQAEDGILNEAAYEKEVQKANEAYKQQIETIKEVAAESERRAKAEADNVQKIIDAYDKQQNIDQNFGGSDERAKAAENLLAIENEIARIEEQAQKARDAGDQKAVDAATARLAKLDQVQAKERDILSGEAEARENQRKLEAKLREETLANIEKQQEAVRKTSEQIAEKNKALAERQFEIDLERIKELADARSGAIKVNDLREGGIAQFFATLQEDPALSEAKKQTKELQKLREDIKKLEATKVDILAGVG